MKDVSQFDFLKHHPLDAETRNSINNSPFCIINEEGRFVFLNPPYLRILGFKKEELHGKHFTSILPKAYREFATNMHTAFIYGVPDNSKIITVQNKFGVQILVYEKSIRCRSQNGKYNKISVFEKVV
jgi:PAS domain S-box-containing protein